MKLREEQVKIKTTMVRVCGVRGKIYCESGGLLLGWEWVWSVVQ